MPAKNVAVRDFLLPVGLLLILTALIAATGLDITLERHFYQQGVWIGRDLDPWRFLYRFGVFPAYLLGGSMLLLYGAGFCSRWAVRFRKDALFLVLVLALGPGLLVNTVFKDQWGRPRPSQLQIFNGREHLSFHQVWERGEPGVGRSFPSGHASAAFYFVAPYFVLRRRSRKYARLALAGGLAYGVLMGVARMAQGGHFPSDVLWAGGIVYLSGLILCYFLRLDGEPVPKGECSR
jgi:lipid A 4'-phosphatase